MLTARDRHYVLLAELPVLIPALTDRLCFCRLLEYVNDWDQYWTGYYRTPYAGAPRWTSNNRVCTWGVWGPYNGESYFNILFPDTGDQGLNFWSSSDKVGTAAVYQAALGRWSTLSIGPVVPDKDDQGNPLFIRRRARFALYSCEATKGKHFPQDGVRLLERGCVYL